MKYFTKQLWANLNLGDRELAKKASKQWNLNMKAYWRSIDRILPELTKKTQQFYRNVSLHDGTLLSFSIGDVLKRTKRSLLVKGSFAKMNVLHADCKHIYVLYYKEIRKCMIDYPGCPSLSDGNFSSFDDWGYDELSLAKDKWMRHEILFSSGATILIEFKRFSYRREHAEEAEGKKAQASVLPYG